MTTESRQTSHVAVITGASQGLGRAVAEALVDRDWQVIIDARDAARLDQVASSLGKLATPLPGSVTDRTHQEAIERAVDEAGRLDLLLNNASTIGASPMPSLSEIGDETLWDIYRVNVFAPITLTRRLLPYLATSEGTVVNISSDAAVEAYEGWGGYGPSKAALDHVTATLAAERTDIRAYAFDPGDMRTALHQAAFPGEDISDRPDPQSVVPALLRLIEERPDGIRFRASDVPAAGTLAAS